jgi:hypothetical protein
MNPNYTKEQQDDIIARTQKVIDFIKGQELEIQAQVIAMDTGDNIFGLKVVPFLKDIKFISKPDTTQPETPKITDVKAEPTISPFVPQPSTDENNSTPA